MKNQTFQQKPLWLIFLTPLIPPLPVGRQVRGLGGYKKRGTREPLFFNKYYFLIPNSLIISR